MAQVDYNKFKVPELKALLRARGLAVGGTKLVLIQRLQGAPTPAQPAPTPSVGPNQLTESGPAKSQPAPGESSTRPEREAALLTRSTEAAAGPSKPKKARISAPKTKDASSSLASTLEAPPKATTSAPTQPPAVKQALAPPKLPTILKEAPPPPKLKTLIAPVRVVATAARTPFKTPFLRPPAVSDKSPLVSSTSTLSAFGPPSPLFTTAPRSSATDIITFLRSSWLERLYGTLQKGKSASSSSSLAFDAISPHLFASPQHDHQFAMSLRFAISRLFLSLMSDVDNPFLGILSLPPVFDCIPVVEGIWEVTTSSKSGESARVLVLEATGEVIGSEEEGEELRLGQANPSKELRVREDWRSYIEEKREGKGKRLFELVRSSDEDDYPNGISKSCRQRLDDPRKAVIATSFLFSQTTPYSISGEYQSSTSEAKALAGLPDTASERGTSSKQRLGFYLPPTQHLESVHLPSTLSPDLAIVQTASRPQFCLRETGQVVGSEEEGVMPMWREVLGCGEQGEVV